jgi:hypothetical protein
LWVPNICSHDNAPYKMLVVNDLLIRIDTNAKQMQISKKQYEGRSDADNAEVPLRFALLWMNQESSDDSQHAADNGDSGSGSTTGPWRHQIRKTQHGCDSDSSHPNSAGYAAKRSQVRAKRQGR